MEAEGLHFVLLFTGFVETLADENVEVLVLLHQRIVADADDPLMLLALGCQIQNLLKTKSIFVMNMMNMINITNKLI